MRLEKIDPGACDTGANENCVLNHAVYSKKSDEKQRRIIPPMPHPESGITLTEWRESLVRDGYFEAVEVVGGDIGPVALIGSPRVCVGFGPSWTVVWICRSRTPWGWSDPFKLFLRPRSSAACKYAVALAEKVRVAADAAQARHERAKAAYLREKFGEGRQ